MNKWICLLIVFMIIGLNGGHAQEFSFFQKKHHTITRELELDIYFPNNYDENHLYPVLFFNDGEGLNEQGYLPLEELETLIKKNVIEPVILVGVYAGYNRTSRYTPYLDSWMKTNWGEYTPLADRYSRQLIQQVFPYVEKRYSISTSQRGLVGISLGGLQATRLGLQNSEAFSFIAALSPSFWVNDHAIFQDSISSKSQDTRFYFDIGTREWNYYLPLIKKLEKAGLKYGQDIFYYEILNATHNNFDWKKRMISIIQLFLLEKKASPKDWEIHVECIPSQSQPGVYFQRINPVVAFDNGIRYSLAYSAKYRLVKGDGKINEDGSFKVTEGPSMLIEVEYENWVKKIKVKNCK